MKKNVESRQGEAAEAEERSVLRPWTAPAFERMPMKEAVTTISGTGPDGAFSYS